MATKAVNINYKVDGETQPQITVPYDGILMSAELIGVVTEAIFKAEIKNPDDYQPVTSNASSASREAVKTLSDETLLKKINVSEVVCDIDGIEREILK